ncbi:MAG TPA: chemotaxis protein CheW [Pyrinomonadaceae bacterium]|nr:chemotaxis protein CheW [Pyrinomonadaceae bacterium]
MNETTHEETMATLSTRAERADDDAAAPRRLFVMRTGARLFAVYADEVAATCENLTPTPLPFAPAPVRGVVGQRGRILTLIDPLPLLPEETLDGAKAAGSQPFASQPMHTPASQAPTPLVIALKGDEQLALSVEAVEHGVELYDEGAHVETDAPGNSLIRRTIQYQTHAVALLDPARLFDAAMQGVERRRRRT